MSTQLSPHDRVAAAFTAAGGGEDDRLWAETGCARLVMTHHVRIEVAVRVLEEIAADLARTRAEEGENCSASDVLGSPEDWADEMVADLRESLTDELGDELPPGALDEGGIFDEEPTFTLGSLAWGVPFIGVLTAMGVAVVTLLSPPSTASQTWGMLSVPLVMPPTIIVVAASYERARLRFGDTLALGAAGLVLVPAVGAAVGVFTLVHALASGSSAAATSAPTGRVAALWALGEAMVLALLTWAADGWERRHGDDSSRHPSDRDVSAESDDAGQWSEDLARSLRSGGQHSERDIRSLQREAAAHASEAGVTPVEAFGPSRQYAQSLPANGRYSLVRHARAEALQLVGAVLLTLALWGGPTPARYVAWCLVAIALVRVIRLARVVHRLRGH